MRIGFTGSQGTGKTCVAKRYAEEKGIYFVPSSARRVAAAGFKVNEQADELSQLLTTVLRITDEEKAQRLYPATISDRTPLDSLAYTWYQISHKWVYNEPRTTLYWETTGAIVENHMRKYDKVFYFPVLWEPKGDGIRNTDRQYQVEIDRIILDFLREFKVPHVEMPNTTVSQRVLFVDEAFSL